MPYCMKFAKQIESFESFESCAKHAEVIILHTISDLLRTQGCAYLRLLYLRTALLPKAIPNKHRTNSCDTRPRAHQPLEPPRNSQQNDRASPNFHPPVLSNPEPTRPATPIHNPRSTTFTAPDILSHPMSRVASRRIMLKHLTPQLQQHRNRHENHNHSKRQ